MILIGFWVLCCVFRSEKGLHSDICVKAGTCAHKRLSGRERNLMRHRDRRVADVMKKIAYHKNNFGAGKNILLEYVEIFVVSLSLIIKAS